MKKQLVAAAVGFGLLGALGVANPGMAQTPRQDLKLTISPNPVAPGGNVHVTPQEPCPAGTTSASWSLGPGSPGGTVTVASTMGGWDINFKAPAASGTYPFFVTCDGVAGGAASSYVQSSITVKAGARTGNPRHTG